MGTDGGNRLGIFCLVSWGVDMNFLSQAASQLSFEKPRCRDSLHIRLDEWKSLGKGKPFHGKQEGKSCVVGLLFYILEIIGKNIGINNVARSFDLFYEARKFSIQSKFPFGRFQLGLYIGAHYV